MEEGRSGNSATRPGRWAQYTPNKGEKMNARRTNQSLVLVASIALMAAACGGGQETSSAPAAPASSQAAPQAEEAGKVLRVGYTPPTLDVSDFMGQFEVGLIERLESYGYDLEMFSRSPADHTAHEQQFNIVQDLITTNVDYIVMIPTDFNTQIAAYRLINESGIPLIIGNYSTPLPASAGVDVVRYAGYSHEDGGRIAGDFMAGRFDAGTKVAILYGAPGLVSEQRGGTAKAIIEAAGLEVVGEEFADWNREIAFQATQDMLTRTPDTQVIFAASSAMAIGAVAAAESMGYDLNEDLFIIGFGGTMEELDAILAGKLAGAVFRDPILTGALAADAIHMLEEGLGLAITPTANVQLGFVDSCESIVDQVHPVTYTSIGREVPTLASCR